jgi:uncharacterized protein YdeI (YjbR/CyaY-like superfamily)
MNPKVDAFLNRAKAWQEEMAIMRAIALQSKLTEDLKWGVPCYSLDGHNVVLIHAFKDYCACLFFKGALLKDPEGVLIQQTENTQATRQIRFTNVQQVVQMKALLKATIKEAIAIEKAGLKVTLKETSEFAVPAEFQRKLDKMRGLKKAFEALTPGRQRAYLLYFSAAKQSATREARIEKCLEPIFNGKGLND